MPEVYGMILSSIDPLEEVVAHKLFSFSIGGVEVVFSNHMFMVTLATVLLIGILPFSVRGRGLVRKGFGNLIEAVCVFIREEMARPFLGNLTDKHIGFIWTVFFFVLTLNLLGMVPIGKMVSLITGRENHIGGTATANIFVTGALALAAFFAIHISGMRQQGVWGYIRNFAPSVPWPMVPFMYFIEILGALVKPFALAIRLFANMLAGHVVLGTLLALFVIFENAYARMAAGAVSVVGALFISLLELFVAFLQAYIFTFLTTIFIGFAVQPEH